MHVPRATAAECDEVCGFEQRPKQLQVLGATVEYGQALQVPPAQQLRVHAHPASHPLQALPVGSVLLGAAAVACAS